MFPKERRVFTPAGAAGAVQVKQNRQRGKHLVLQIYKVFKHAFKEDAFGMKGYNVSTA